eukprot:10350225-Karenia_brevis.AAC.1
MQHKPLQVLACVAGDTRLEDIVTISLMSQFGWERVRGGRWCQLALEGPPDAVMRATAPQKPRPDPCNGHAAPDGGACSASRSTAQDGKPAPPQPGEQEVQGEREPIAIKRAKASVLRRPRTRVATVPAKPSIPGRLSAPLRKASLGR